MIDQTVLKLGRRCRRLSGFARGVGRQVAADGSEPFTPLRMSPPAPQGAQMSPPAPEGTRDGGCEIVDLYEFQVGLGELLVLLHAELVELDNRHVRAVKRDRELRQRRRQLTAALRAKLSGLRDALSGVLEPGAVCHLLRPLDRLPEEPEELARRTARLFAHLTDPALEPPPVRPGVEIDPTAMAAGFEAPMRQLGATVDELVDVDAAEQHYRAKKVEAVERLRGFAGRVERFFGALYDVTGNPGLAKRLLKGGRARG